MEINRELVKELIKEQFIQWSDLEVKAVEKSGHDNRTFYLGDSMSVRLPSGEAYASQIEKEVKWIPYLKPHLSLDIPNIIAKGEPSSLYPYSFGINSWLMGETLDYDNINSLKDVAMDLANFFKELQRIDAKEGPLAGKHNFYRGGDLDVYGDETIQTLEKLKDIFPVDKYKVIWEEAISSKYSNEPVWIHGDVAVGNLLVKDGKLSAVIDFGILGTGDPACDYVMAWTFFDKESREVFKNELNCDDDTWNRAKGWALWKALISYEIDNPNSEKSLWAIKTLDNLI